MERLISCDWGTTRLRVRLVQGRDAACVAERVSNEGAARVAGSPLSPAAERSERFVSILRREVEALAEESGESLRDLPVVVSGMASSSIGWAELPYARLPFALDGRDLEWRDMGSVLGDAVGRVALLSGVCSDEDVIRGEEVEVLGAAVLVPEVRAGGRVVLLLPGTHSKHIFMQHGAVQGFRTYMTGELYDVLRRHTVLQYATASCVGHEGEALHVGASDEAFLAGVEAASDRPLSAALFRVRTRALLQHHDGRCNSSFLAGVLIGAELVSLAEEVPDSASPVVLAAGEHLRAPFEAALGALGWDEQLTVIGEDVYPRLTGAGHLAALRHFHGLPAFDRSLGTS